MSTAIAAGPVLCGGMRDGVSGQHAACRQARPDSAEAALWAALKRLKGSHFPGGAVDHGDTGTVRCVLRKDGESEHTVAGLATRADAIAFNRIQEARLSKKIVAISSARLANLAAAGHMEALVLGSKSISTVEFLRSGRQFGLSSGHDRRG